MTDAAFLGDPSDFFASSEFTYSPSSLSGAISLPEGLSQSSLPPSQTEINFDILPALESGSALNNEPLHNEPLKQAWLKSEQQLKAWYTSDHYSDDLATIFGLNSSDGIEIDAESTDNQLIQQSTMIQNPPLLSLLPIAQLQANGAFAAANNTIYLAEEFIAQNSAKPEAIAAVLLEELGHFIDAQFNERFHTPDAPGDEGAIFSARVRNQPLVGAALAAAQQEDDSAILRVNGQTLTVEQSGLGEFIVGSDGQVQVDLVFDGGAYEGQLGMFSLSGMEALVPGSVAYIREATRRALSNSVEGYVVASDGEGARFSGSLPDEITPGLAPAPRSFSLIPGDRIAFFLVPNGSVNAVFANPDVEGDLRPLFSVEAANPEGLEQFAQLSAGVFAIEDLRRDRSPDNDFEDFVIAVDGASGSQRAIADLIAPGESWLDSPAAALLTGLLFPETPAQPEQPIQSEQPVQSEQPIQAEQPEEPIRPEPLERPEPEPSEQPIPSEQPLPAEALITSEPLPTNAAFGDIESSRVVKFYSDFSEAEIAALNGPRLRLGSQTIYTGTQQVTAINQNPIVRSFDSANPANNWTRTDYEVTGSDGRAQGLFWSGRDLYGVFTVDGTQGDPSQDFRRAAGDAQQSWLRSYGQGGGGKIAVVGRLDPATGELLDAAHLSAVLTSGNSNSFTVDDILLNSSGNLVIRATIAFAPRNPDGSRMYQVTPGSSPFDYTLEITPDLKQVVSTNAPGWIPEEVD